MLSAFDLDGKPKWTADHGPDARDNHPGARATPTIDGGNLYLLSGVGALGCFDAHRPALDASAKDFGGRPGSWGYAESVLIDEKLASSSPAAATCIVALDKTRPAGPSGRAKVFGRAGVRLLPAFSYQGGR